MNTLLRSVVALMALALFSSLGAWKGAAADLVWRVQSWTNRIYLAGSIHVLRSSDYPLPSSFDFAFQSARVLILEADLDAAATRAFQDYVQAKAQFPAGTSLRTHVSAPLYGRIQNFAVENGFEATAFDNDRPWFVGAYVAGEKYRDQGLSSDLGVDQHYFGLAKQLPKPRKFLETPQQQIDAVADSAESDSVKGLSAQFGLLPASQYPVPTGAELIAKWRAGQIEAFEEQITVMSRETPSLFENVVRKRNQAWLPQIEAQLKSGEVAFVLVGALHFAGTEGLLAQLGTRGYSVTQLPAAELPPTITGHPQRDTKIVGQSVQFSVTATGTEPLTYQWQHNGQNIPAATGPTFSIASVQLTNAGDYRVIVGNFVGNATSDPVKLTVVRGNVITPSPGFLLTWDGNDGDGANPVADNLATMPGATVITSSDLGPLLGLNYHLAENVNDGLYGNANSWISGFGEPAYAAVVFRRPSLISGIAFGRDNLGATDDRCLGIYTIQFTKVPTPTAETGDTGDAASGWQTIGTVDYLSSEDRERGGAFTAYLRHKFKVGVSGGGPLTGVTAIRIIVAAAANQALDEVEVFGDYVIDPADPDNDGFDTDVEVALGYDPKNTGSSPSGVSKAEPAFEFSFYAARWALYRIETSTDLKTWTTLEDNISGTGGEIRRLYSMRGQSRLHYRAVLRP